jgi:hypothetical protein
VEHTASASITLAHHAGAESTRSRRFGCGTGGHAARDAALPLKATNARAERAEERTMVKALRAQIEELKAEVAVANAEADRALAEERLRSARVNEQVVALSAKVVQAEKRAEATVGRAEQAGASRDVERAEAEALRTAVEELRAGQALMIDMHARELAVARHDALAAQQAAAELGRAEAARKARGLLARLRDAWRGE